MKISRRGAWAEMIICSIAALVLKAVSSHCSDASNADWFHMASQACMVVSLMAASLLSVFENDKPVDKPVDKPDGTDEQF